MLLDTQKQFEKLSLLSSDRTNSALLVSLEKVLENDPTNNSLWLTKETLYRRMGKLSEAAEIAQKRTQPSVGANLSATLGRGFSLKPIPQQQDKNYKACPVFVVDDFLPIETTAELINYVVSLKTSFRKAKVDSDNPTFSPEKRQTLVLYDENKFQQYFLDFLTNNFERICGELDMPAFNISKIEIKHTNHLDGGFFHVHSDNPDKFEKPGRAISWLYYFHQSPKMFQGGDLLVFDTNLETNFYDEGSFTKIVPMHNRLVAFPSWYYHTVTPVKLANNNFSDGRMAVAGHIKFK